MSRFRSLHLRPLPALLLGGLTVGTLDILDAIIFFGVRGVSAERILQSIAAGLLGREAFDGGMVTAALGLLLHFFIAFTVVGVFLLASGRIPALRRNWVVVGLAYGGVIYATMNLVVLPLTHDAPAYDAFVEECFPAEAMTDPQAFFDAVGDQAIFDANLATMMDSCGRFIDFARIDVIPTSQHDFSHFG
jgi:hypothetical protein